MKNGRIDTVEIAAVANQQRVVPLDDPLISMARAVGTCLGN
jgi:hypothetical protein